MNELKLKVKKRKKGEKLRIKNIPAVLYGPETESLSVWVDYNTFEKIYEKSGESALINLLLDDEEKERQVLIYDVQRHPVKNIFRHIDFFQIKKGKKIETEFEINYVGVSPAVKELGGILLKNIDTLEIKCLPQDLPEEIKVDISSLKNFDDCIRIKDVDLPKGVKVELEPETVVAIIVAPRSEDDLKELEEKSEIDMNKIGKVEEKKETKLEAEEDKNIKK